MSTFIGRFRTNHFRVRDPRAFRKLMSAAGFAENSPYNPFWTSIDSKGRACYAFGSMKGPTSEVIDPYFHIILEHPEFPRFNHQKGCRDLTGFKRGTFPGAWLESHGLKEPDPSETFMDFCRALQPIVAEDDAVVIIEAGYEKLRYVGADATIITPVTIQPLTFNAYIDNCLKAMLGSGYTTRFEG